MLGPSYLEHLTSGDLRLLGEVAGSDAAEVAARPRAIERLIADPRVHRRLFEREDEPFVVASPFLVFAVLVQRCAAELSASTFTLEWAGPGRRLPVFDAPALSSFLDEQSHRLFLAELLASFTHTASGVIYRRDRRGWRTHRFSELDPVRLAALLEVVDEREHPGIYRRLGDSALFLTGVFPQHSSTWVSKPLNADRLQRVARSIQGSRDAVQRRSDEGLGLLQEMGRAWYRLAYASASPPRTQALRVVASVAQRFEEARRVLNLLTDRYLFPVRSRWFPGMGADDGPP